MSKFSWMKLSRIAANPQKLQTLNPTKIKAHTYGISGYLLAWYMCIPSPLLQMVSVERAIAYSKLEPEAPLETPPSREKPPEAWPQHGGIQAQQVNFRYAEDTPYILKDVSIDIKPGEKVGMKLRTGLLHPITCNAAFNRVDTLS